MVITYFKVVRELESGGSINVSRGRNGELVYGIDGAIMLADHESAEWLMGLAKKTMPTFTGQRGFKVVEVT